MARRAIVTACSGDPGYFEAFLDGWCRSLAATTDLDGTDVWLIDYGLDEAQRKAVRDRGVSILEATRDGSIPNIRWRDLPRVVDAGGPYAQVMMTDGSDICFQGDVTPVFERATRRIAAVSERFGDLSRDHYLKLSLDCLSWDEIRFLLRRPPVNTGVLCGPTAAMLDLCRFAGERITGPALQVAGPDYVVLGYFLHSHGFEPLDERFNYIAITSQRLPEVVGGELWSGGERVCVVHNAAAGLGVFEDLGRADAPLRVNWRVLRGLRRGWKRYAFLARTPLLRRFTWAGRALARDPTLGSPARRASAAAP